MSGWTVSQTTLASRMLKAMLQVGPAAIIGLSTDMPSTAFIPRAFNEAQVALEFADVGNRVVLFSDVPVRQMLLRLARDHIGGALPHWVDDFLALDDKSRGKLSATLRAYADANMNVQKTGALLKVHPNTVYSRIQRINDSTGLDPLNYHALTELLLAVDCRRH